MGKGGGSNSSSTTVNETVLNTTTNTQMTTIIETDELAKALEKNANATLSVGQADLLLKKAQAEAELTQNAIFVNELEGGIKKWALLGVVGYGGYKIFKKGKLLWVIT